MAEQNPKVNRRCQSALIFTASDGRTISSQRGASPPKSAKKPRVSLQQQLPPQQQPQLQQPDTSTWLFRRVSAPPGELSNHQRPSPSVSLSHFYSPSRCTTPSKPPRSLNFTAEGLIPRTPSASHQKCPVPSSAKKIKHKAAMKLKALENERIEASRYEQDRSYLSMEAQEKAYGAWLNHVLLRPMKEMHSTHDSESETSSIISNDSMLSSFSDLSHISSDSVLTLGDRFPACDFSASPAGKKTPRADKRSAHSKVYAGKQVKEGLPLDASFQAICSIPVLRTRLDPFVDVKSREDIISIMINLAKHIDDGRLKMKDGCAILTDVALKENLIQAMLNYNTPWLKIGLHVVLGHNALLLQENLENMPEDPNHCDDRETQQAVLRLIIEKHFLSHAGLAKYHATNKKIEGLYKTGYHEALARVILKRLLLLVLTLDKAKCQSAIPLARGIDGLDDGSPLLFLKSGNIKSSRHALQEFLLNSMHGEGDVVGHLSVLGYHVAHIQAGLADYSFEITNLIEDLKDGVRLCRLVQVLLGDTSILLKVKIPSDRPRRWHQNCGIALERLARAGVSLMDAFGCSITADDVLEGDQERVLRLLWNIMLSLQIPVLVNAERLRQEIVRIHSCNLDSGHKLDGSSVVNLLLMWIQAACMKFGFLVKNFTTSFADGQALCHLISYYYPMLLPQAAVQSFKPPLVSMSPISGHTKASCGNHTEIKAVAAHNLALFQLAISKLGCIPGVLQVSHFVEDDPFVCEKSIIIMLVFLYYRLLEATPKVEDKMAALSWDAGFEISELRKNNLLQPGPSGPENEHLDTTGTTAPTDWTLEDVQQQRFREQAAAVIQAAARNWLPLGCPGSQKNDAATVIQRRFRGWILRRNRARETFLYQKHACLKIQQSWRIYSAKKLTQSQGTKLLIAICKIQAWWRKCQCRRAFLEKKTAALRIQCCFRSYRQQKQYRILKESVVKLQALAKGRYSRRQYWKYKCAAIKIQRYWRGVLSLRSCVKKRIEAVIKVQSHWRKCCKMRSFARKKDAVTLLQRNWRRVLASRLRKEKQVEAATKMQCCWRRYSLRKSFVKRRAAAILIQKQWREVRAVKVAKQKQVEAVQKLQSHWRRWKTKKSYARTRAFIILLQSYVRAYLTRNKYVNCKKNVTKLQALVRGRHQRKKFRRLVASVKMIQCCWRRVLMTRRANEKQHTKTLYAAIKLQAFWRSVSARKRFVILKAATIDIQSSVRRYICRARFNKLRENIVRMQALARRKQARMKYSCLREGVVKVQAFYRGRKQLRRYKSCRDFITRRQAFIRGNRERQKFIKWKNAALTIQRHFRKHLYYKKLSKARASYSAMRIQHAWRNMRLRKAVTVIQRYFRRYLYYKRLLKARKFYSAMRIQQAWRNMRLRKAATIIQAHYRGWRQTSCYLMQVKKIRWLQAKIREALLRRRLLMETVVRSPAESHQMDSQEVCNLSSLVHVSSNGRLDCQTPYHLHERHVLHHWHNAAIIIQKHFRRWQGQKAFIKAKVDITRIQAVWRGFWVRHKHGHLKEELSALRQRMQITATNVDRKMRLEYRLTEALAALLSQKTVSGILHTCATIDLATHHSKLCCERLLEAGAIPKLLQLIQTTNRSPPHEEILKHSLSILGNLARYPPFATLLANAPGSMTIVAEQLLRNNEEVISKVIKLLQLICKVPSGLAAIQKNPVVMKRLHNFSQVLEKKVEMEARALGRLPQTAVARRLGEKKVSEAAAQHYSVVLILQKATGEDLQTRLKAVKRLSSIPMVLQPAAPPRLSVSRFPLQDCSNH